MKRSTTKLEFLNSGYILLIGDSCGLLLNYYLGKNSWIYAKAAVKKGENSISINGKECQTFAYQVY